MSPCVCVFSKEIQEKEEKECNHFGYTVMKCSFTTITHMYMLEAHQSKSQAKNEKREKKH